MEQSKKIFCKKEKKADYCRSRKKSIEIYLSQVAGAVTHLIWSNLSGCIMNGFYKKCCQMEHCMQ